jgi:hypothetical protein
MGTLLEVTYTEISLGDYVAQRIEEIFTDVAEGLSEADLPEDVSAGVPLALFHAEVFLKRAWLFYIEDIEERLEGGTT